MSRKEFDVLKFSESLALDYTNPKIPCMEIVSTQPLKSLQISHSAPQGAYLSFIFSPN